MFRRERTLSAYLFGYARLLTADLPDEKLAEQPAGILNHPAWTLGHLAIAADMGLKLLGAAPQCPPEWTDLFGRGSTPTADRAAYPSKAELMNVLENAHGKLSAAVETAEAARLDGINPVERNRASFPTLGDLIAHLMTSHVAVHLGQLSAWRRAAGLPSVM